MSQPFSKRRGPPNIHEWSAVVSTAASAVQENLACVVGRDLMRLPVDEADSAFYRLQVGQPQPVVTGKTVAVLFSDGTPFTTLSVHELTHNFLCNSMKG